MFLKQHGFDLDLSTDLHEQQDWKIGTLRSFEYALDVTALAYEPISGLLAIGTAGGVIELLGRPGVDCKITLPDLHAIKVLHISASAFKLVCLDDYNQLHIYDLASYGRPKLLASTRFDQANSITISPSHSHALIALQTGEVRTFDLVCLQKSPYTMPNMWSLYEEKMAARMPELVTPSTGTAIDTVIHPRDLNLVFVVYGGGIVLSDLTERSTLRVYEHTLPPGAPGAGGLGKPDILTHRRPEVTCMAIHPAGHFFAVGYTDGSFAFWAVEDEDQPLLVRTLDSKDVNLVDATQLEAHLSEGAASSEQFEREPIFKLSWCSFPNSSDARGGDTALVILGGLRAQDSPGISVHWLPAFNPPEPPTPSPSNALHPFIRSHMRQSVEASKSYFYYTDGTVQDFLVVPRESPHFLGAFDPVAILITRESVGRTRVVEGYQFPPPIFLQEDLEESNHEVQENVEDTLADMASTLRSLQTSDEPRRLHLPAYLSNGCSGLRNGLLKTVDKDSYQSLVQNTATQGQYLPLNAGYAWLESKENLSKYQPSRILVTFYANMSVQMWDTSAQLLLDFRPDPIQHDFPKLLPGLSIETNEIVTDATVSHRITSESLSIQSIELATQSLEVAITFSTGDVAVYRLAPRPDVLSPFTPLPDSELLSLEHIPVLAGSRYTPFMLLSPGRGQVSACALADVGFLAVAYHDGSLFVVDMRGPKVVLRTDSKVKNRHSIGLHLSHSDRDPFTSLLWTISAISTDNQLAVRLVAARESGSSQVITFAHDSSSSWAPVGDPVKCETPSQTFPRGLFVIDSKSGAQCAANRTRLAASLEHTVSSTRVLLIAAGAKGARSNMDITGERIGKLDWSSKMGKVLSVQIVEKLGSRALVAFTDRYEACAYSLPTLEFLYNLAMPPIYNLPVAADETGDFFAWTTHAESGTIKRATYGTLFNFRRLDALPAFDFLRTKPVVPAQPQPVSLGPTSILGSWFRSGQSMTGAELDSLLGGPNRPIPTPQPRNAPSTQSANDSAEASSSQAAEQISTTTGRLYDRLTSALQERGQMLGDLEDRFNSLETGSRSMVDQAKRLATEQSAKRWFNFG